MGGAGSWSGPAVASLWRWMRILDCIEDWRRHWLEWRGRGEYVSTAAVRRAEARADQEQLFLYSYDGRPARASKRARLKRAVESEGANESKDRDR